MLMIKISLLLIAAAVCLAAPDPQDSDVDRRETVVLNCDDQAAVAEAIRNKVTYRCAKSTPEVRQGSGGRPSRCPPGQIFNSELGFCVKDPNSSG